jgi:cytochrome P450 family 6
MFHLNIQPHTISNKWNLHKVEMFFYLAVALSSVVFLLYLQFRRRYKFWRELGVLYPEPSFPTGNVSDFLKSSIHFSYVIQKLYVKLKQLGGDDYGGIYFFGNPVFLVLSPEFAKTVLVRDFHYFHDRGIYFNAEVDVLSANVFFLRGHKWKTLREKISPTFSTGKLKQMFFTILEVGQRLEEHLMPYAADGADIDVRDVLGRFMTDVIGKYVYWGRLN